MFSLFSDVPTFSTPFNGLTVNLTVNLAGAESALYGHSARSLKAVTAYILTHERARGCGEL